METEQLRDQFKNAFAQEPILVRAPGRINIIGEHVDYNDGFVLPGAIDKEIRFAVNLNSSKEVNLLAHNNEQSVSFSAGSYERSKFGWPNYFMGVMKVLEERGIEVPGINCHFWGNIPIGAGLSSSAALESGFLFALNELLGLSLSKKEMALIGQKAENDFVGVQCGIMDQFASIHGEKGKVFKLDCRDLSFSYFPFSMDNHCIILCNSLVSHSLADSEYNLRRSQCEEGTRVLNEEFGNLRNLRDASLQMLESCSNLIDPVVYKRCEFVLKETRRVGKACDSLSAFDLHSLGQLIYESHQGLQNDYEVSCPELDFLVEQSYLVDGVLGARMMGGGFGGCTLNVVEKAAVKDFEERMKQAFKSKYGKELPVYVMELVKGVGYL